MSQKLYLQVLDKERSTVFSLLKEFKNYGFLAGGTALALQIHHRYSYDFDIFCYKKISDGLIQKCLKIFPSLKVLINSTEEFSFLTKSEIKITFLYYPFTFPGRLIMSHEGLPILNIVNIAASKAYTLNRRGSFRDYVDLYFIIRFCDISLKKIIHNAKNIFGELFSPKLFLGQLLYTRDLDPAEIKSTFFIAKPLSLAIIYRFFKKEVRNFQKQNM